MALVKCPSCRNRMSSVAKVCPQCGFSRDSEANISNEEKELFVKRKYRDKNYRLKMFSYVAMSIAMLGAIPMLWKYINSIENAVPFNMREHWGIYLVAVGFFLYLGIRYLMIYTKKSYIKKMHELKKSF